MRSPFALLLTCLGILVLGGCLPRPPAPPSASPATEAVLLKGLAADSAAFQSLKGVAKVKIANGGRSFSATQILLVQKPDRLRTEVLSFFGQPMLLLATDGAELTVFSTTKSTFYRGPATPRNLQRILRVPLRLDDLVHVLLYQVPVIEYERSSLGPGKPEGSLLTLFGDEGRRQTLRFDGRRRLVEADYFRGEKHLLRITYGGFADQNGRSFPRTVHLDAPPLNAEASVVFSDVTTNVTIPESRFSLTPPPGTKVLPIP
jgi:outer membrane lipoprotein-sorting protein